MLTYRVELVDRVVVYHGLAPVYSILDMPVGATALVIFNNYDEELMLWVCENDPRWRDELQRMWNDWFGLEGEGPEPQYRVFVPKEVK